MGTNLNEKSYRKLVEENIAEVEKHFPESSLEKSHIIAIMEESIKYHYPDDKTHFGILKLQRDLSACEKVGNQLVEHIAHLETTLKQRENDLLDQITSLKRQLDTVHFNACTESMEACFNAWMEPSMKDTPGFKYPPHPKMNFVNKP